MADYTDLIARLTKATGPDRELDADIYEALGHEIKREPKVYGLLESHHHFSRSWVYRGDNGRWVGMAYLTASIDSALALVERCLPGWRFSVGNDGFADLGPCWARVFPARSQPTGSGNCYAETPPLAILAALLRALQSQEPTDG